MALHVISSSPSQTEHFALGFAVAGQHDAILLVGNAVYAALSNANGLEFPAAPCPIYALEDDMVARGISVSTAQAVTVIDYQQWVNLTVQHEQSISWFE